MLNGAPTAVLSGEGILTVSTNVTDGSAAAVHLKTVQENGHSVLDVNVNGQNAFHADSVQVQAIHIAGSSGSDTLVIDFSGGNPIPHGGLIFDGKGQAGDPADSLQLTGGGFSGVNYSITAAGVGSIQLAAGNGTSVVALQNVEQVNDSLNAANRSFQFSTAPDNVTLSAATETGKSQLNVSGQAQFIFQNPTGKLSLNTDQGPNDADHVTVNGVGSSFHAKLDVDGDAADQVSFTGRTDVGTGDVNVSTGQIDVQGAVVTDGGNVAMYGTSQLNVGVNGSVETRTAQVRLQSPELNVAGKVTSINGGSIELNAGPNGSLLVSGQIDASTSQPGANGGTVHLLGSQIGLFGNAAVNVSGMAGGGTILVGGDAHGANPYILNAAGTYVGTGVTLKADAGSIGNGGKIIVWSDRSTIFLGALSARGGANGGSGGFAEVSGGQLRARGTYDLSAPAGERGTLLFDPINIQIVGGTLDGSDNTNLADNQLLNDAGSNALGSILFTDNGSGSPNPFIIYESEIEGTDANIILEATRNITTSGTFTNADVVLMNNRSLTLRTRNNAGDGAGGINLTGSTDGSNLLFRTQGTGSITIEAATDGGSAGNISLGRLQTDGQAIDISTKNGTVTFNANVAAGAGSVTVTSTGAISQTAGGITTSKLTAKTLNDTPANIILDSATNNAATIDLRTRNTADAANVAGTISYQDADGFDVAKVSTTANATLKSGGAVTQSGSIQAAGLELLGSGPYTLTSPSNAVTTLAGNVTGSIQFSDIDGLSVGLVNTSGLTASNITISAGDGVTQTEAISTNLLTVKTLKDGGANITLNDADNAVTSLDLRTRNAADSANAAGAISYRDINDIAVNAIHTTSSATVVAGGTVTQSGAILANVLTVKTLKDGGAAITLNDTGNAVTSLDLRTRNAADSANAAGTISFRDSDGVDVAAIQTTGSGNVVTGGAITQSGAIVANSLVAKTLNNGGAAITLNNTSNAVASIDLRSRNAADNANTAGAISYRDTDGVSVTAIQTTGSATIVAGDAITQTGAILANDLTAKTLKDGGAAIMLNNSSNAVASIDLRSRNAADSANAAGSISYRDTNGLAVAAIQTTNSASVVAGAAITQTGAIVADSLAAKTLNDGGAAITLNNTGNAVTSIDLRTRNAADNTNAAGAISYRDSDAVSVTAIQTTSSATIVAGDTITQTGAILANALTAKTLKNGGAAITLNNTGNAVTSIDLRARNAADSANAAGSISYLDSDGFSVTSIQTTSSASLTAGDAITQTGAILADALVARTLKDGGANITLTNAGNAVASIDLRTRNTADSANAAGTISYRDSDGFDVVKVSTTANATLQSGGAVAQSGSIQAAGLELLGSGPYTLTNANNQATTLAGNVTGNVQYTDSDGLSVGSVNTAGLSAANVTLIVGDTLNQSQKIQTGALVAKTLKDGGAAITLTESTNAVISVDLRTRNAADNTDAAGTISYRDTDGFDVAKVSTTANAALQSGAAVTQSGTIQAAGLELLGTGPYTLTNTANAITTLAGNVTGNVQYTDLDSVSIGTVNTTGLSAANVTLIAGDTINQSEAIQTGALVAKTLKDSGANITLTNSANAVTSVDLRTRNAADTANSAGTISYRDTDGFDVAKVSTTANSTLQSGAAVTQSGSIAAAGLELLGAGPYTLTNTANAITTLAGNVTGNVQYTDSDGLSVGTVNTTGLSAANITLIAGDTINQSQAINTAALVAMTLKDGGAAITLTNSGNAVTSVDLRTRNAADTINAAGTISYHDSDGFDVVKVSTTANATLQSGGAVTQSGTIQSAGLELLGTGPYTLTNSANAVTTLAGNVTGSVQYTDSDGLSIGTVNTVGLSASSVTLIAGDTIDQSQAIQTGALIAKTLNNGGANITLTNPANAVTSVDLRSRNAADTANAAGTISYRDSDGFNVVKVSTTANATLQSGGAVTQSGTIQAVGLELLGSGPYTLSNPGNDITTLAGNVTNAVTFRDANSVTIGTVNTVGLTASDISLTLGDAFNQNQAIKTGTLVVKTLKDGGANITLTDPANDVDSIDLRTRNAADTADAAGTISFRDADGFDVVKISTTANATLRSGAVVTQSGIIAAAGLELLGTGPYTLNNAGNAITTLAANVTGDVQYRDSDALTVGTVNTVGVTAANVTLVAGGAITQSQAITTAALVFRTLNDAGAAITLTNAANAVATIDLRARSASDTADAAGQIDYRDINGFDVVRVATTTNATLTAGGSITESGSIQANALRVLTLNNAGANIILANATNAVSSIDLQARNAANTANTSGTISYRDADGFDIAKIATTANATLQAGDTVTQSAAVEALGLELLGTGSFVLTNFGNTPAALAGNTTGSVQYNTSGALTIGTVNTAGLAAVNVELNAGGAISQNQAIQTNILTAKTLNDAGAAIVLNNGSNAVGSIDLRSRNAADSANAAGAIVFVDSNGFDVAKISTTANAILQAGAAVTESGSIEASGLELLGSATYSLTNSGNSITTLAANVAGGIDFVNSLNTGLTIGAVNGTAGITNAGSGLVQITSGGPLNVQNNVLSQAGGNIVLQTTSGDLTTNARVAATGGSGNLTLAAAQNLLLNDSGANPDIQTAGNGIVTGTAGGSVVFGPNVMVQSGLGQITDIPPKLTDVFGPQITSDGLAEIFGQRGRVTELDFTVIVDWSDGTIDIVGYTPPGQIALQHFYDANPNAQDSSAPIPVTLTLFGARNINFPGQNSVTAQILLTTPGDGLGRARIDIAPKVPVLTFPAPVRVEGFSRASTIPSQASQLQYTDRALAEGTREVLRQVFLEILAQLPQNGEGTQTERVQLPESVLDDLSTLFKRLPDGRYRLTLLEAGETQGRVLLEFDLRQHKISDSFEEGQRETPTDPEPVKPQSQINPPQPSIAKIAVPVPAEQFVENRAAAVDSIESTSAAEPRQTWPTLVGGTVLSAGMLMAKPRENWAASVDSAMEQEAARRKTTGSRLVRRFLSLCGKSAENGNRGNE